MGAHAVLFPRDLIPEGGVDVPAGAMFSALSAGVGAASPSAQLLSPARPIRGQRDDRVRAPRAAPHSAPAPSGHRGAPAVLSPNYLARSLGAPEAAGFRAAGVFAFHRSAVTGRVSVLFGLEGSASKNAFHLNLLGGKVDHGESALQTASREYWEESGTVFAPDASHVEARLKEGEVLWYRDAKYAMHFLELTEAEADIDRRYAAQREHKAVEAASGGASVVDEHSEMDELLFIDLYVLLKYLNAQIGRPVQGSRPDPVMTSAGPRPMINFTCAMLNCPELRERMIVWLEATNGEEGQAQAAEIRAEAMKKASRRKSDGPNRTPRKPRVAKEGEDPSDYPSASASAGAGVAAPTSAASAASSEVDRS